MYFSDIDEQWLKKYKCRNPDEIYNGIEMHSFVLGQECKCRRTLVHRFHLTKFVVMILPQIQS